VHQTALVLLVLTLAACGDPPPAPTASRSDALRSAQEPVRITMDALHQAGGTPPGWRFTLPDGDAAAGRKTFADLGCHSCHVVKGEPFPASGDASVGPELTGMGSHHPPTYFAESIVNPDAVIVDGPDHVAGDGHSRMPTYPDLTLVQLVDLVAYLSSLTDPSGQFMAGMAPGIGAPRPPAPVSDARMFFVQSYDVKPGQLDAFARWFTDELMPVLRDADGFVSAETHVDTTRPGPSLVTVLGFRDAEALAHFLDGGRGAQAKQRFDSFIGPHGHQLYRTAPLYRVDGLSAN